MNIIVTADRSLGTEGFRYTTRKKERDYLINEVLEPYFLNPKINRIIVVVGENSEDLISKCRRCKKIMFVQNQDYSKNWDSASLKIAMSNLNANSFLWISKPTVIKNVKLANSSESTIICVESKNKDWAGLIKNNDKILGFCKKERIKWTGQAYIVSKDYNQILNMDDYLVGMEIMLNLQPSIRITKSSNLKVL